MLSPRRLKILGASVRARRVSENWGSLCILRDQLFIVWYVRANAGICVHKKSYLLDELRRSLTVSFLFTRYQTLWPKAVTSLVEMVNKISSEDDCQLFDRSR
jgi:hypothetical protein